VALAELLLLTDPLTWFILSEADFMRLLWTTRC